MSNWPDFNMGNVFIAIFLYSVSVSFPLIFGHSEEEKQFFPKIRDIGYYLLPMQIIFVIPKKMKPIKNGQIDRVIVHVNPEILLEAIFIIIECSMI